MKKILSLILTVVAISSFSLTFAYGPASAQGLEESIKSRLEPVENVYDPQSDVRPGTIQETIARIIRQFLGFLGIIFIVLMVYAGFTWMTAAGDEGKIDKAKKTISAAIIGLAIILVAYGITYFVTENLIKATGGRD